MFTASTTDLYFPKPHTRVITNSVRFTNSTGFDAVIKMRTTARDKFHVRPRLFALPSGQSIEVSVSNRAAPSSAVSAGANEVLDCDECHAVIHKAAAVAGGLDAAAAATAAAAAATPNALQAAWDAGTTLGRVVLRCRVAEPPATAAVTYQPASGTMSKSPSMSRLPDLGGVSTPRQHGAAATAAAAPGATAHGLPPLAGRDYARDAGAVAPFRMAGTGATAPGSRGNAANVEAVAERLQAHEGALDRSVAQLARRAAAATAASVAVTGAAAAADDDARAELARSKKPRTVPLSLTVLCMLVAFAIGLLLRQSAAQAH